MVVPEVIPAGKRYIANGSTLNFPYDFAIETTGDIVVFMGDVEQVYLSHYWLTGVGSSAGGEVQFTFFPPDGIAITILRAQDIQQIANLLANSSYPPLTMLAMHNRHTAVDQMLAERIARAPKFLPSSTQSDIPMPTPSSDAYLGWNTAAPWEIENKTPVAASSINLGNSTPKWISGAGSAGVSTEVSRKDHVHPAFAHNVVSEFGIDNTGSTDVYAALQAVIDSLVPGEALYFPSGVYKLSARIIPTKPITILGDSPNVINFGLFITGQSYTGTWFYFNHSDIGIYADGFDGVRLQGFGTRRNQPTLGPGWVPTAHDFDIVLSNMVDSSIDDLLLLNATRGIKIAAGSNTSGRITIKNVRGQFFDRGIEVESAADVITIDNFMIEPYWVHDFGLGHPFADQVLIYTSTNCLGLVLYRMDLMFVSNYFAIFVQSGIWIGHNAYGTARKILLSNISIDFSTYTLFIDAAVNAAWLQFDTLWGQGGTSTISPGLISVGMYILGDNCIIDAGTFNHANPDAYAVRVDGTGNIVRINRCTIFNYDVALAGYGAFDVGVNNTVFLGTVQASTAGAAPKYTGAGAISVDEWRAFVPVVTPSAGAITSYTSSGQYKVHGNLTIEVEYDIAVTDNGTGSGEILIALPGGDPLTMFAGSGLNMTTGAQNSSHLDSDNNRIVIRRYDGAYPVATGQRITGDTRYRIAAVG